MGNYPNYRNSVEIVVIHDGKILLTKRADDCQVAPGVWNVPAGKVKYEETPLEALYREAKEEINVDIELIKELNVRAFKSRSTIEDIYRVVFTYLVKSKEGCLDKFCIDEEHSEFAWVDRKMLDDDKFHTLNGKLKEIIIAVFDEIK